MSSVIYPIAGEGSVIRRGSAEARIPRRIQVIASDRGDPTTFDDFWGPDPKDDPESMGDPGDEDAPMTLVAYS